MIPPSAPTVMVHVSCPPLEPLAVALTQTRPPIFVGSEKAVVLLTVAPTEQSPSPEVAPVPDPVMVIPVALSAVAFPVMAFVAHSLAQAFKEPIIDPALALACAPWKAGKAVAAKTPRVPTVTISSIRVKPLLERR